MCAARAGLEMEGEEEIMEQDVAKCKVRFLLFTRSSCSYSSSMSGGLWVNHSWGHRLSHQLGHLLLGYSEQGCLCL